MHISRLRKRSAAAAVLGAVALIGSLFVITPAQALNDTGTGGVFVPASGRVLDATELSAGTYQKVQLAGVAGIPDDGSVGAVSLNATVSGAPQSGSLFARPDANTSRTMMLIYNGTRGEYTSNTGIVALGADGTIQVMAETSARLILSVQGYYTSNDDGTAPGGFVPVDGKRIIDTRSGLGASKATVGPGKSVDVQVTGSNGVPIGASGAVVNLLPINTTSSDGYLTPYETGTTRPSNALHYAPSTNTSIQAQVSLSADGKMTIYNGTSTVNLVIDLQGYFTAAGTAGATFTPGVGRVYDSRAAGNTILGKNETRSIQIAGRAGVPVVGSGISAVVLTLTASHAGSDGRAVLWADDRDQPDTTSINFRNDEIRTNTVTVPLAANGKISLNNVANPTDYLIDVQGWYASPVAPTVVCPYAAGSTTRAIPADDFSCSVTAPIATGTNQELVITVDGADAGSAVLSAGRTTDKSAVVTARGGEHRVDATIYDQADNQIAISSVMFNLGGDWETNGVSEYPTNTAYASADTGLYLAATRDEFPEDVVAEYTLTENPDGHSDPIEISVPTADVFQPAAVLTAGRSYFWTARITGTSADSVVDKTVGPWKFTAAQTPIDNYCAEALLKQNAASGKDTQADDFNICAYTPAADEDAAPYDGMGVMTPAATFTEEEDADVAPLSTAVLRASNSVRTRSAAVHLNSRTMIWKSTMKSRQYFDGTSAWSLKTHRRHQGFVRCNTGDDRESYSFGPDISVENCANYSPKGKDIVYEEITIRYGIGHIGPEYPGAMHATLTKSGKQTAGKGVGF